MLLGTKKEVRESLVGATSYVLPLRKLVGRETGQIGSVRSGHPSWPAPWFET